MFRHLGFKRIAATSVLLMLHQFSFAGDASRGPASAQAKQQTPLMATARTETASTDWNTGGGDASQRYYSTLDDINRDNVSALGYAWPP